MSLKPRPSASIPPKSELRRVPALGYLIPYSPAKNLVVFAHQTRSEPNTLLLFIPGLGDGFLNVPYVRCLAFAAAKAAEATGKGSTAASLGVVEVQLSSCLRGWGSGSVERDADEIAECITALNQQHKELSGRPWEGIYLLGHSTGCQDIIALSHRHPALFVAEDEASAPLISGVILQAPVSDREGLAMLMTPERMAGAIGEARNLLASEGRVMPPELLPAGFADGVLVTPERFLSLAVEEGGEDFFSSDLSDAVFGERVFGGIMKEGGEGRRRSRVLALMSGRDEHVPPGVDKEGMMERWRRIGGERRVDVRAEVVEGASHSLRKDPEEVVEKLVKKVLSFIGMDLEHS